MLEKTEPIFTDYALLTKPVFPMPRRFTIATSPPWVSRSSAPVSRYEPMVIGAPFVRNVHSSFLILRALMLPAVVYSETILEISLVSFMLTPVMSPFTATSRLKSSGIHA